MPLAPGAAARSLVGRSMASVLLLVLTSCALFAGQGCGGSGSESGAILASTGDLWSAPQRYEGRRVRTTGVVLGLFVGEAGEHYVIEGPGQQRVELRDVDHERLSVMSGRRVEVIGRFHFSEDTGFGIVVESIRVVG